MCRAKAPNFSALTTLLFRPGQLQKTPFEKCTIIRSVFPTWADWKDPRLKKTKKKKKKKKKKPFLRFRMNLNLEAASRDDPLMS